MQAATNSCLKYRDDLQHEGSHVVLEFADLNIEAVRLAHVEVMVSDRVIPRFDTNTGRERRSAHIKDATGELSSPGSLRCADMGCGEGTNTRELARLGANMSAVDIAGRAAGNRHWRAR